MVKIESKTTVFKVCNLVKGKMGYLVPGKMTKCADVGNDHPLILPIKLDFGICLD